MAETYEQKDNLVSKLKPDTKNKLPGETAQLWADYTEEINDLIDDSREAWDFYLHNHPKMTSSDKDKKDRADTKRKGLRLGHIPRAVDSIVALLHNSIFPVDDRFFKGSPRNEFSRQNQELYEQYRSDNFGMANTSTELRNHLLNMVLDGTACLYAPFKREIFENKTVWKYPTLDLSALGMGEVELTFLPLRESKEDVTHWEGTKVEALDFNDWRVDPTARSFDDACFLRRWYLPVEKVKEMYPWVKEVTTYNEAHDDKDNDKREAFGYTRSIPNSFESYGEKMAMLMVRYDDFYLDGKAYKNHLAVVLNDKELIWFGPNPYNHGKKPYIVAPFIQIPGQIHGQSAVKHAIPSAEVIDKAVEVTLKTAAWAVPIILKNMKDAAVRKTGSVKVEPGMTLPVESEGAYRQLPVSLANLTVVQYIIEAAMKNIEETTGANPFIAGQAPEQSDVTAFEVDQRVQGGNSRFQSIITNFCNLNLEPLMYQVFENDKQYKSVDEFFGDKVLTPDMIKRMDFRWVITSAQATMSRNRELANMKGFLEMLPTLMELGVVVLSGDQLQFQQNEFLIRLLTKSGMHDADKLLVSAGPVTPPAIAPEGDMNATQTVPPTPNIGAVDSPGTNYAGAA